ncbi:uncharacterized protein N7459_003520 [Penicillium hispanicum]|uniref:uncharacterized protein n=1 Tax=Penicillium hispanicum TaxID=1080232 RepID=UPI002541BE53|nr:uncharacterized protein N7459_003520 [Penicillium hispanicum]KAJ5587755.1 hypothetical protein N7459_003520 [Penicillium hispanicum]
MATQTGKRTVTYGRHSLLQTISVTTLKPCPDGYWVIYIHGGAWRDPTVTSSAFDNAESILRSSPGLPIAGFASISYRLSAHPNHPQDQATTPPQEFRYAKHPDHIRDVEAALAFLQNTYGFGPRYILVGHSCGATLAFQSVMGAVAGHREQLFNGGANDSGADANMVSSSPDPLPPRLRAHPTAIVGVAGIYDIRRLVDTHRDISAYRQFIEGAFGADELLWDTVSPAQMIGSRGVEGGWKSGRLVVLAHSKDDELVDKDQLESMREALKRWEGQEAQIPVQELTTRNRRVRVLPISGAHDEAWLNGDELARAIKLAFVELQNIGLSPGPESLRETFGV